MKFALMVIDMQKAFYDESPAAAQSMDGASLYINAAISLFREKGLPVICIQDHDEVGPGDPGYEVIEALHILPDDLHIEKTYGNAFNKTPLERELKDREIDGLVITGFAAEHCVLSTYRGAQDLDLHPIILRDGLASEHAERIKFVEEVHNLISFGSLRLMLS